MYPFTRHLCLAVIVCFCLTTMAYAQGATKKIRVLFLHGGHSFDKKEMYEMLDTFADIEYDRVAMPAALDLLRPGLEKQYDCIVSYDFYTFPFTGAQVERYKELVQRGIGLVAIHHSTGGYENWDEYPRLIGGKYVTSTSKVIDGITFPRSTYQHDETMNITVADPTHPIMQGIEDFTIVDETYGGVYVKPESHILLTTDHPLSTKQVAWTWNYGNSRVFVTLLGHDAKAYKNPDFQRMVRQAIRWTTLSEL